MNQATDRRFLSDSKSAGKYGRGKAAKKLKRGVRQEVKRGVDYRVQCKMSVQTVRPFALSKSAIVKESLDFFFFFENKVI